MTQSPFKTICYAVAVAMGVAVLVTNFLIPQSITVISNLLAIGLAAIGIANLS